MRLGARIVALGLALAPATATAAPRTVAVLYFDNNTQDRSFDVLSKGLADMLVTDLSGVDGLVVVEREKLQALVKEMNIQRSEYFDPKTAQKMGRGLGATHAITGSIAALEPRIRLDVRVIEVATGKVVAGDKVVGDKSKLFELEEALVAKLVRGLRVQGASAKSRVSNLDALLQYSQGLDAVDQGDLKRASSQMAKVTTKSPGFALAKKRYREILQRQMRAEAKREDALEADETELRANMKKFLSGKGDVANYKGLSAAQRFGYRILRAQMILNEIKQKHAKNAKERFYLQLKDPQRAKPLLVDYYETMALLIREVERWRVGQNQGVLRNVPRAVGRHDVARAKRIGIEEPAACFSCPEQLPRQLAMWAVGEHDIRIMPVTVPSLADLDPEYGKKALALLSEEPSDGRATVLLALGRPEEAMANWQALMEKDPGGRAFQYYQEKVKKVLGVSKAQLDVEASIEKCDARAPSTFGLASMEMYDFGGAERVRERVTTWLDKCHPPKSQVTTVFSFLISHALMEEGCGFTKELAALAKKSGADATHWQKLVDECR